MNRCLSSSRGVNFREPIFLVRLDVLLLLIVGFEDHRSRSEDWLMVRSALSCKAATAHRHSNTV
jgi:hypothetical protein